LLTLSVPSIHTLEPLSNKLKCIEAAQVALTDKLHHFKHHTYPHRVCYPLAFERSGYLHKAVENFIDLYSRCSSSTQPQPQSASWLRFAVAFAITFTTATLVRVASLRLLPRTFPTLYATQTYTCPNVLGPFFASTKQSHLLPRHPRSVSPLQIQHEHTSQTRRRVR
jgi:hypothetical protein